MGVYFFSFYFFLAYSFDTFAPAKEPSPPLTLNVGFINSEDRQDETQLDVDASSFEATLVDFANLLFSL